MKDQSGVAIQYSGYPLKIADLKQKPRQTNLKVIRPQIDHPTTSIQQNKISNDPQNWDLDWFQDYE
jgi:hypothetical protein